MKPSSLAKALAVLTLISPLAAAAQTTWILGTPMHIGGPGGWDYVSIDSASHRIFVTRSTHTQVLDEATGKVLGDIPGQLRSHGTAVAPSANRGFITDGGGTGAILVFDLKTYAVLGKLAAAPDADGIIYDATLNRVIFVSGDANALYSFKADIDLASKIDPPIALGGSPEFLASDGSGKVYVNIQDKDVVAEVDLATHKVLARWPTAPGGSPVGLAIDPAHHRLFIGCRKPARMIVMSTTDGKILADLPIGSGVDATAFANGQAFASTGDGNLTVISDHNGTFTIDQTVKTQQGARTMNIDPTTGKIFLPTSLFDPPTPGTTTRPKQKPDTFMLIEVDASK